MSESNPRPTFVLTTEGLVRCREKLAKLNKKLAERSLPSVTLSAEETSPGHWTTTVEGSAPALPGFSFRATLEHLTDPAGEPENVVACVPGCSVPEHYRTTPPLCDHCGLIRRRSQTFVIQDDRGEYRQVGRNCLAEYVGDETRAETVVAWVEMFQDLIGTIRESAGRRGGTHFSPREVVQTVLNVIAVYGWKSRAQVQQYGGVTTSSRVIDLLTVNEYFGDKTQIRQMEALILGLTDAERAANAQRLEAIFTWLADLRTRGEGLSDYQHNLAVLAGQPVVELRHIGLLSSAPSAYLREVEDKNRPAPTPVEAGKHFGEIDARVECDVAVDSVKAVGENDWGIVYLISMRVVPTGERLKWFTGESCKLESGQQYHVKLTVNDHNEWQGRNETKVNRVMIAKPTPDKKPRKKKGE